MSDTPCSILVQRRSPYCKIRSAARPSRSSVASACTIRLRPPSDICQGHGYDICPRHIRHLWEFFSRNGLVTLDRRFSTEVLVIQISALRSLLAVVDAGSFAKAARTLGVDTSTLTRRVTGLEDELGLTLLDRKRSGVRPTSGGAIAIVRVRRTLADLEILVDTARANGAGQSGEFRLGLRMSPVGDPFRRLLGMWRLHHPMVVLTLHEMPDHDLYAALTSRRLDVALLAGYGYCPNLVTQFLFRERLFAALHEGHVLASRAEIRWHDLRNETILVQEWEGSHATREFYASLIGIGIPFRSHSASEQSVFALIAAGFGVTLATESQAQVKVPGMVYRRIAEDDAVVEVKLAWMPNSEDAVAGRFISFIRDQFRCQGAG
jgi:DNA-binding transcriptional LysR family regulator